MDKTRNIHLSLHIDVPDAMLSPKHKKRKSSFASPKRWFHTSYEDKTFPESPRRACKPGPKIPTPPPMTHSETVTVNCVAVGDSGTGKSAMIYRFTERNFAEGYCPTVLDYFNAKTYRNGVEVDITIWDVGGGDDIQHQRLRGSSLMGADVVLLCFSISQPETFESINNRWMQELETNCRSVPIILVGNKLDVRETALEERMRARSLSWVEALDEDFKKPECCEPDKLSFVMKKEGERLAEDIGATEYIECSSMTGENCKRVFESAAKAAFRARIKPTCSRLKPTECCVM